MASERRTETPKRAIVKKPKSLRKLWVAFRNEIKPNPITNAEKSGNTGINQAY